MKDFKFILFFLSFNFVVIPAFSIDSMLNLNREVLYIGEPLTLFFSARTFPEKLNQYKISLDGNNMYENNPLSKLFIKNQVIKNDMISHEILIYFNSNGDFIFDHAGKYKVTLQHENAIIDKVIQVKPLPDNEKDAFLDYEFLRKEKLLLTFMSDEWDKGAYNQAKDYLRKHPSSLYSKLPAIYYANMSLKMSNANMFREQVLKIGNKVDINAIMKYKMSVIDKNLKLLSNYDFNSDGFIQELADMAILRNKVAMISASHKMPDEKQLEEINKLLGKIQDESSFKQHLEETAEIKNMLQQLNVEDEDF